MRGMRKLRKSEAIGSFSFARPTHVMTLTLELPSEVEKLLCAVAKERGVSLEEVVALYPDASE